MVVFDREIPVKNLADLGRSDGFRSLGNLCQDLANAAVIFVAGAVVVRRRRLMRMGVSGRRRVMMVTGMADFCRMVWTTMIVNMHHRSRSEYRDHQDQNAGRAGLIFFEI